MYARVIRVARSPLVGLPLPAVVERTAYRIVQEALTNVHKHAAAAPADVPLRYRPTGLEIVVHNDPPPRAGPGPGRTEPLSNAEIGRALGMRSAPARTARRPPCRSTGRHKCTEGKKRSNPDPGHGGSPAGPPAATTQILDGPPGCPDAAGTSGRRVRHMSVSVRSDWRSEPIVAMTALGSYPQCAMQLLQRESLPRP